MLPRFRSSKKTENTAFGFSPLQHVRTESSHVWALTRTRETCDQLRGDKSFPNQLIDYFFSVMSPSPQSSFNSCPEIFKSKRNVTGAIINVVVGLSLNGSIVMFIFSFCFLFFLFFIFEDYKISSLNIIAQIFFVMRIINSLSTRLQSSHFSYKINISKPTTK